MRRVYYFQRYSQKENWVTNNTLLLLSRLYQYNRLKFETVLNTILSDNNLSLNIGVKFIQQERAQDSIPDGVIEQDSFRLLIETKLYDNFDIEQLKNHIRGLQGGYSNKILLALSKNEVSPEQRKEINQFLKDNDYQDIKFASTSFEHLIDTIDDNLDDYEVEMKEILDDYSNFCEDSDLIDRADRTMLAFTAGESLTENLKYGIYYDPDTRNHNLPFHYVGLYNNKTIVAIGKLTKIVYCHYENGELKPSKTDTLDLTDKEYKRIKEIIEVTDYYDLRKDTKFFLVDKFIETRFKKVSPSSLRMKRYFFLDEIDGFKDTMDTDDIATLLNGKEWE